MAEIIPITSRVRAPDEPFDLDRWRRFARGYLRPFREKNRFGPADCLLDWIAGAAFGNDGASLKPVSKAEVLSFFTDLEAEDAETALRLLEEEGLVEVAGGEIRVPARFWAGLG